MRDSTTRSIFTYKYIQWWLFWQIEFKISFLCRWHFKDKEANYNSCQHLICLFYIWQCSNKTSTPPTRWQVFCTVLISAQNICHWAESKSIRPSDMCSVKIPHILACSHTFKCVTVSTPWLGWHYARRYMLCLLRTIGSYHIPESHFAKKCYLKNIFSSWNIINDLFL